MTDNDHRLFQQLILRYGMRGVVLELKRTIKAWSRANKCYCHPMKMAEAMDMAFARIGLRVGR